MKSTLAKSIAVLICFGFAVCRSEPAQNSAAPEQPPAQPATQEIVLRGYPTHDITDYDQHLAWSKVSKNNKLYKLSRPDGFRKEGLHPYQCHRINECVMIVTDQTVKDASRYKILYKILVLYAKDKKGRNYRPYWVTCNRDLSRTSLYNSNIGVIAVEYLEVGGYKASVIKWDEESNTFTCNEVDSPSLVFP